MSEILFSSFRITFNYAYESILKFEYFTIENLQNLLNLIPSQEIIEQIISHDSDKSTLAASDQFIKHLSKIPRLKNRISNMIFRSSFIHERLRLKNVCTR